MPARIDDESLTIIGQFAETFGLTVEQCVEAHRAARRGRTPDEAANATIQCLADLGHLPGGVSTRAERRAAPSDFIQRVFAQLP